MNDVHPYYSYAAFPVTGVKSVFDKTSSPYEKNNKQKESFANIEELYERIIRLEHRVEELEKKTYLCL